MNAYMVVNNELEPSKPDAIIWQPGNGKRMVGIADIHHHLSTRPHLFGDDLPLDLVIDLAVIDVAPFALSARDGDVGTAADRLGRVTGTNYARYTKFATDYRAVTGASASLGDYRRRAFHDRLPCRIGHRRYKYLAFGEGAKLLRVHKYVSLSGTDLFTNRHARNQRCSML